MAVAVGLALLTQVQSQRPYEDLVCSYAWPCDQAMRVMLCESRGNPLANGAGNRGLFQINSVHARRVGGDLEALFDPEVNVAVAFQIWSEQGWRPWGCRLAAGG